jgi:demethoxyubiquinone hydroxylase (CLK1/Coq7/Cat5 family)
VTLMTDLRRHGSFLEIKELTLLRITWHSRGALVGSWTAYISCETSVGTRKLVETIEKLYSHILAYTLKVCKG